MRVYIFYQHLPRKLEKIHHFPSRGTIVRRYTDVGSNGFGLEGVL